MLQPIKQWALSCVDPLLRLFEREPFGAVDLREGLPFAAAWRPFDLEIVAANVAHVEVELGCERGDELAPALLDLTKRGQRYGQLEPKLFGKLPPCGDFRIFLVRILPLRDRPCAEILVAPERASGMNEENLEPPALPIGNDPRRSSMALQVPCRRGGGSFGRNWNSAF